MENIADNDYAIGVDIGGSHITAAIINLKKKIVVNSTMIREKVNSHGTAGEILGTWVDVISDVIGLSSVPVKSLGIAMPGPFDYENGISLIKNMNKYDSIYGYNIKELLAKRLNIKPANIHFKNDAEAFLEGEVMGGIAHGYNRAIGITLGTGLGSAKSIDGVTKDMNLGSSPYLNGIAEDYMSTRWFVKRFNELTGRHANDAKQVADHMHGKLIFDEFSSNLERFLYNFIKAENTEIVVIGGNIANASALFLAKIQDRLSLYFPEINVRIAILGEEAPLLGAVSCFETDL